MMLKICLIVYTKKLPTVAEKYIIHWYGENNYPAIQTYIVELLRRSRMYKAKAEQSPRMQKNYDSVKEE